MTDLYFAYGSNLHAPDRRAWCARRGAPDLAQEELGPALLPDRRLIFDYRSASRRGGALDLAPAVGHVVEGQLFRIRPGGWALLDEKEGAREGEGGGRRYRRVAVWVFDREGRPVQATTYEVTEGRRETTFIEPRPEYVQLVREGLLSAGLSPAPLEAAARDQAPRSLAEGVFVYGTLLPGELRHAWITASGAALGPFRPATTPGLLYDLGAYPALVPRPGSQGDTLGAGPASAEDGAAEVHGAFASVEQPERLEPLLLALDEVEGFYGYDDAGSLYLRGPVRVRPRGGAPVLAWTYLIPSPPPDARLVQSGSWRDRHAR